MSDVPGFDPSKMSDDELLNRYSELGRRSSWASRFGSGDMSWQLQSMMMAIEAERRDRLLRFMFEQRQKIFSDIIETEPDLAATNKKTVEVEDSNDRMAQRRRVGRERAINKTSEPQNQIQIPHRSSSPQVEGEEGEAKKDEDSNDG